MLTESGCEKLIDEALSRGAKLGTKAKPVELEVSVTASNIATSRFANNEMTQNQAPLVKSLSVRVLTNGRQARLDTEDLSKQGIKQVVENAYACAGLLDKDKEMLPLLKADKKVKLPRYNHFDSHTATTTPLERAEKILSVIDLAKAKKVSIAGFYSTGEHMEAIGNSRGLFQFYKESSCECSLTALADSATSWAKAANPRASEINTARMAERVIDKALAARRPQEITPGRYLCILEPSAVLDLLGYLWWDFTATSHVDKLSCLLGKVGKKVFGSLTIEDNAAHPLQFGSPFDGEGQARSKVTLVENGVVKSLVTGRRSAQALNLPNTGHALPEPSSYGEMPVNIVIHGGDTTLEEMIASVQGAQEAILITRVWYVREVDPALKLITGMTRDGTFLVKNGAIEKPLRNLRFNVSLLELLNNVVALGPSERTAGQETFTSVVPPMMLADFNFTEATKF